MKNEHISGCKQFCTAFAAVILCLATVVSVIGAVQAHVVRETIHYGSAQGSLSLIALAVTLCAFLKVIGCCRKE
jgi:hypothetical protein